MKQITAQSKRNRFLKRLERSHPGVAELARLIASRKTSATSMVDLASATMPLLQAMIEGKDNEEATRILHEQRNKIIQVADWAAATGDEWRQASSLDDLYMAAEIWHDKLSETSDENAQYVSPDEIVYSFPNGWNIVKLKAENAEAEGNLMGHCVGGYADDIADGKKVVYSLRDPNNKPHVTFNTEHVVDEDAIREAAESMADDYHETAREEELPEIISEARNKAEDSADDDFAYDYDLDLDFNGDEEAYAAAKEQYIIEKMDTAEEDARYEWERAWDREGKYEYIDREIDYLKRRDRDAYESDKVEQIQGKEDEAPIDRYRPYLREFFKEKLPDVDLSEVKNRLKPVSEVINGLLRDPEKFASWVDSDDIKPQDLAPYFEKVISDEGEVKPGDVLPISFRNATTIRKRAFRYALSMMNSGGGERYERFVDSVLSSHDAVNIIYNLTVGKEDPIRDLGDKGMKWLLEKISSTSDPNDIDLLIRTKQGYDRAQLKDPAWQKAIIAAVKKAYQRKMEIGGQEEEELIFKRSTPPALTMALMFVRDMLGAGPDFNPEAIRAFESLMSLFRKMEISNERRYREAYPNMNPGLLWSSDIMFYIEGILSRIWIQNRDLFSRLISLLPPGMVTDIKNSFENQYPSIIRNINQMPDRPTPQLQIGETRNDRWKNYPGTIPDTFRGIPADSRRIEPPVFEAIEKGEKIRIPDEDPASQLKMQFASSKTILRLATLLEEISPNMADRLESLVSAEV